MQGREDEKEEERGGSTKSSLKEEQQEEEGKLEDDHEQEEEERFLLLVISGFATLPRLHLLRLKLLRDRLCPDLILVPGLRPVPCSGDDDRAVVAQALAASRRGSRMERRRNKCKMTMTGAKAGDNELEDEEENEENEPHVADRQGFRAGRSSKNEFENSVVETICSTALQTLEEIFARVAFVPGSADPSVLLGQSVTRGEGDEGDGEAGGGGRARGTREGRKEECRRRRSVEDWEDEEGEAGGGGHPHTLSTYALNAHGRSIDLGAHIGIVVVGFGGAGPAQLLSSSPTSCHPAGKDRVGEKKVEGREGEEGGGEDGDMGEGRGGEGEEGRTVWRGSFSSDRTLSAALEESKTQLRIERAGRRGRHVIFLTHAGPSRCPSARSSATVALRVVKEEVEAEQRLFEAPVSTGDGEEEEDSLGPGLRGKGKKKTKMMMIETGSAAISHLLRSKECQENVLLHCHGATVDSPHTHELREQAKEEEEEEQLTVGADFHHHHHHHHRRRRRHHQSHCPHVGQIPVINPGPLVIGGGHYSLIQLTRRRSKEGKGGVAGRWKVETLQRCLLHPGL